MKAYFSHKNCSQITDNSSECGADTAFLSTRQNQKYLQDAKDNGCEFVLEPHELYKLWGLDGLKFIGVTGTNGKTTTTAAIYSMLLDLGYKCALLGTRGFFVNDKQIKPKGLTTPTLLEVYSDAKHALDEGCEFFVMEVSSHAIHQGRIDGIEFALRAHTNITSDHLDYHKSIDEYIATKNSFLANETMKVINKDDPVVIFNPKNAYTYGIESSCAFVLTSYTLRDGLSGTLKFLDEQATFFSSLFGRFNLYNLLCAMLCVKLATNRALQEICDALEEFGGVSGRMEIVSREPLVIIDFAHTEDGMNKVFESFLGQNISVVFGAGGDRDSSKRPKMGRAASIFAKKIYITSDNPRSEEPLSIVEQIASGIEDRSKVRLIESRKDAIARALSELQSNEVLLVLGKGDEDYQEIKGVKHHFSDKEVILELLNIKN